ncbi:hypothetical protein [Azospirillum cavernae]|uniref:hypothetical protein n=1 Tax=Azospirillum cavernae TaxID=2320860 RepID=UPI0013146E9B|nr:hypothetical protein [Azospirillum cavernae]
MATTIELPPGSTVTPMEQPSTVETRRPCGISRFPPRALTRPFGGSAFVGMD